MLTHDFQSRPPTRERGAMFNSGVSLFSRPPPLPSTSTPPSPPPRDDSDEEGEIEIDAESLVRLTEDARRPAVVFEMPVKRAASPPPVTDGASAKRNTKGKRKAEMEDKRKRRRKDEPKKDSDRAKQASPPPKRTPIACKFYLEGKCRRGDDCDFSHDVERPKKTELCKFYLSGACFRGEACIFSHDTSSVPCFFLQTKKRCANGDQCRFSHSFPSDAPISRHFHNEPKSQPAPQPEAPLPVDDASDDEIETHVAAAQPVEAPFSFALPASTSSNDLPSASDIEKELGFPAYRPPAAALAEAIRLNK